MPKKIRFQLALADGTKAGSLEALKKHFDLESVISYYNNGDLLTWLRDRNIEAEADAVEALDATAPDFQEKLCTIFGAAYVGPIDMEELASRQKRIERLRKYTDDDAIIKNINSVAFDQEELTDLLDADLKEIYLCGDNFSIPVSLKGKTYIGVNQPHVRISGKSQDQELSDINVIDCIIDGVKKESEKSTAPILNSEPALSDSTQLIDNLWHALGLSHVRDFLNTLSNSTESIEPPPSDEPISKGNSKTMEDFHPIFRTMFKDLKEFVKIYLMRECGDPLDDDEVRSIKLTDIDRYMLEAMNYSVGGKTDKVVIRDNIPEGLNREERIVAKAILGMSLSEKEQGVLANMKKNTTSARSRCWELEYYVNGYNKGKILSDDKEYFYETIAEARRSGWFDIIPPTDEENEYNFTSAEIASDLNNA